MGSGWKVGRLAGIDISIHPSWLVIAFLITYSLAGSQFPRQFGGWSESQYWIVAGATAALFFASVLAHELSHAVLARRFGLKVEGITLFIFGGVTSIDTESRTPREEALIAAAGPATSLLIGAVLIGIDVFVDQPQLARTRRLAGLRQHCARHLQPDPGLPDGRRPCPARLDLEAPRGPADGDPQRRPGRAPFRLRLVGLGVFIALQPGGIVSGLWLAVIGWFLSNAAESTLMQAGVERSLNGVRVRDAMDPNPPAVSPNETVADLVNERMLGGEDRSYLVRHDDGGLAGIVTLKDVSRLARDDWPVARVTDIMTRFADLVTIGPDAPMAEALHLIQARLVAQLPVVEPDSRMPLGMVTRRGILKLINARMKRTG